MTVADRIKARREELNMTQEELALSLGLKGKSSVCKIESSGDNISTKSIKKYAKALNVSIAYLMGWEITGEPSSESVIELKNLIYSTFTENENVLLEGFRSLDEESQRQVINMIAFLKSQGDKK